MTQELQELGKLALALSKAQAKFKHVEKNATNPFYKSKYSTLDSIIDASRDILADNELAVSQWPITQDNKAGIKTLLLHSSGQYLEDILLLPVKEQTAQAYGSAITYARRYSMAAILNLASDEDDDGHGASHSYSGLKERPKVVRQGTATYTAESEQKITLAKLFNKHGIDPAKMKEYSDLFIRENVLMSELETAIKELKEDNR